MQEENILELRNVGIKFSKQKSILKARESREFWALKDITFDIKKGEVLGVIGKNGAGKSTLLALLAGIISPTTGTIETRTKSISLLSLQAGFVPFLSGRKNIVLSGMLMGFSKNEMIKRLDEIIAFAELEEFIDEPVVNYSAGMKTRLGFATAINIEPDVILIDEVLGVGDAAFKKKSSEVLKAKLDEKHTTALIVSHSESTIRDLCDRVVFIQKGVTQFMGDVEEGLRRYNQPV